MSKSTLPHEIWKPIPGYEGLYSASDRGRIRSEERTVVDKNGRPRRLRERILRLCPDADGYLRVSLRRGGSATNCRVHRLVLLAFAGPGAPGEEVRHINGDATDNRADNLRWGTSSENKQDTVRHGKHMSTRKTHCPRGHQLAEPNLVAYEVRRGRRGCLACARARAMVQGRPALRDKFEDLADSYFLQIMRADSV